MGRKCKLENNCGVDRAQAWVSQSLVEHWEYAKGTVRRWSVGG